MKRFYKLVSTREEAGGHTVLLDGKPVKTPGKKPLLANNKVLADALMREWAAQKEKIIPEDMPLTQIVCTKIDRVSTERTAMTKAVLDYLDTDLLCYRTDFPPEVAQQQAETWDPHLTWFSRKFGVSLLTTLKLEALKQPADAHAAVKKFVASLDDDHFTILQLITSVSGSLILALSFTEQAITPQQVFDAARVEERYKAGLYNEAKYGPDPMQEKKDRAVLRDLTAAAEFLGFLKA